MNELYFFAMIFFVLVTLVFSIKQGKEALITFITSQWLFANIFVLKQITLFGLTVPPSDVFTIGGTLGFALLYDAYGKETADSTLWGCFNILVLFACAAQFHIFYTPSPVDYAHQHFEALFATTPRIILASLIAFIVSQHSNFFFLATLSKKMSESVRVTISLLLSQAIDTLIFAFLGLHGLMHSLLHVFIVSYGIKVVTILCSTTFLAFVKKFIKL